MAKYEDPADPDYIAWRRRSQPGPVEEIAQAMAHVPADQAAFDAVMADIDAKMLACFANPQPYLSFDAVMDAAAKQAMENAFLRQAAVDRASRWDLGFVSTRSYGPAGYTVGPRPTPSATWPRTTSRTSSAIYGFKRANMILTNGEVKFQGVGSAGPPYGPDARAGHGFGYVKGSRHKSPDPTGECRNCGFHAVSAEYLGEVGNYASTVTLEVELTGTVIRHRKGYRGERQRVLRGVVDHACTYCGEASAGGLSVESNLDGDGPLLYPACRRCRPLGLATIEEAAGLIGTELIWEQL